MTILLHRVIDNDIDILLRNFHSAYVVEDKLIKRTCHLCGHEEIDSEVETCVKCEGEIIDTTLHDDNHSSYGDFLTMWEDVYHIQVEGLGTLVLSFDDMDDVSVALHETYPNYDSYHQHFKRTGFMPKPIFSETGKLLPYN